MKSLVRVGALTFVIAAGITTFLFACPSTQGEATFYSGPDFQEIVGWRMSTCCPVAQIVGWGEETPYFTVRETPCETDPWPLDP